MNTEQHPQTGVEAAEMADEISRAMTTLAASRDQVRDDLKPLVLALLDEACTYAEDWGRAKTVHRDVSPVRIYPNELALARQINTPRAVIN